MTTDAPRLPRTRILTGRHVLLILLGFFGVVFATNAVMITLAVGTFPGTEVPSSYRAGRQFPAEIAAARAQAERGWQVDVALARDGEGSVSVRVEPREATGGAIVGLDVMVRLEHPADRSHDREITLVEQRRGVYSGRMDGVAAGQWVVLSEARQNGERLYRARNRTALP
jgi:nitrogen fixation protein FixH